MSAAEHRREAARHTAVAREHEQLAAQPDHQHPPGLAPDFGDDRRPPSDLGEWPDLLGGGPHDRAAQRHLHHAQAHRSAARTLEAFEDAQCAGVPTSLRAVCPLTGFVSDVEPIDGGVRLRYPDATRALQAALAARCHAAFGRTQGREGMPGCPLYLPDLEIRSSGDVVDIVTPHEGDLEALRQRSRATVPPPPDPR